MSRDCASGKTVEGGVGGRIILMHLSVSIYSPGYDMYTVTGGEGVSYSESYIIIRVK